MKAYVDGTAVHAIKICAAKLALQSSSMRYIFQAMPDHNDAATLTAAPISKSTCHRVSASLRGHEQFLQSFWLKLRILHRKQ